MALFEKRCHWQCRVEHNVWNRKVKKIWNSNEVGQHQSKNCSSRMIFKKEKTLLKTYYDYYCDDRNNQNQT